VDRDKAIADVKLLVDKYQRVLDSEQIKEYSEEDTKKDFILPLFEALGWDVTNKFQNEVTAEKKISRGRVDYAFRIHEIPKFFLEAKSFRENIDERKYIDQAINYSWLKGVTWAILTNFKKIKVFNTEIKASNPALILFFELDCQDFITNFDKLFLLSKESLDVGLLDKKAEEWGKKLPKKPLDERLFSDFTTFRGLLSENILRSNKSKMLKNDELEESVQRIISRLIFIRTLEDRKYEEPMLLSVIRENQNKNIVTKLNDLYRHLDGIYDAKLFAPHLCEDLQIDDYPLRLVIEGLYRSEEQLQNYDFEAMDADILGGIYEQYLGHILKQGKNGIKVNGSTAHKKEEGIYYTPKFIVDFIVKTIFNELEFKKIDLHKITVLDPSCGSGSFLIKSYDYFLNKIAKKSDSNIDDANVESPEIQHDEKLRIIQNNIFGVDLDPMAVEITQLNLFLKGVEKKHTLPTLKDRIKCGNSLILDRKVDFKRWFEWEKEFPEIFKNGGFDVIIGNPPYIKLHTLDKNHLDYFYEHYFSATKHFDIYTIFVEKALSLLKDGGIIGFILPSKFFNADYGVGLRKLLSEKKYVMQIVNFKDYQVFEGATTYTCLLFLRKSQNETFDYYELHDKEKLERTQILSPDIFSHAKKTLPLGDDPWNFTVGDSNKIMEKLEKIKLRLSDISKDIFAGFQTGRDKFFIVEMIEDKGNLATVKNGFEEKVHTIEKEILKKSLKGKEIRKWHIDWQNMYVVYPYEERDGTTSLIPVEELKKKFPRTFEYFLQYKEDLKDSDTQEAVDETNWYRQRRARSIEQFESPKILTQVLSSHGSFAFDENGEFFFVGGGTAGGFGIILKGEHTKHSYVILSLLNSKVLQFYLENTSTPFAQGFFAYGKKFIKHFPIVIPTGKEYDILTESSKRQVSLAKRLNELGDKKTSEQEGIEDEMKKNENFINEIIYSIYNIDQESKKSIEDALK